MENSEETPELLWIKTITFFVILVPWFTVSALWEGWVAVLMWGWFIEPTFGIPTPGLFPMIGTCLVLGVMLPRRRMLLKYERDKMTGRDMFWEFVNPVFLPALTLVFGFFLKLCM